MCEYGWQHEFLRHIGKKAKMQNMWVSTYVCKKTNSALQFIVLAPAKYELGSTHSIAFVVVVVAI